MPSSVSGSTDSSLPRGGGAPRPQARSAGMAERPGRNESLSDLVRFFQTQNMPAPALNKLPLSPDTTTALPAVESKESPTKEVNKELKPLHRRLLQFTQRQKKDPSPRSKADEQQRQIEALQRGGYLLSSSGHKSKSSIDQSKNSLGRSKASLERTFSRSRKQDVETIGQPWLENKSDGSERRLSSLDLDDFGSMVDVAVSLSSDFEDSLSPLHQGSKSSTPPSRMDQRSASQSTSALTMPSSSPEILSHSTGRPMSPSTSVVDTQGSRTGDEYAPRSSTSTNPNIRIVERNVNSESQTPRDGSTSVHTEDSSDQLVKSEPKQGETRASENYHPKPTGTSSHVSLKLFPDVAPPRISSKYAWRISSMPRYQTPSTPNSALKPDTDPGASDSAKITTSKEKSSEPPLSSQSEDGKEPVCSGALITPTISSKPAPIEMSTSEKGVNGQTKSRPSSLAMGTLQAFPLPAPTKPLPSIPKPVVPTDGKVPSSTRAVRLAPKASDLQPSQPSPIAEDPSELGIRPSAALGHTAEVETAEDHGNLKSPNTTPERPKSTSPEQHTPKRRAASVRVPRMQDLPESHTGRDDVHTIQKPLAESPLFGQMTPTKSRGNRAARKGLQINPRANRNNIPFGLPSPPPTATLRSAPPSQPLPERPGHCNYPGPTGAGLPGTKDMDMVFGPGSHRGSVISRSNSSRSSLRHESIPESCEPGRSDSPLPSSDDEGFGPSIVRRRSRRTAEEHKPHTNPTSRGHDTVDGRRSHGRPCYPHPMRSLTPQGRSSRSFDNPVSPQSQFSQSTYGSRESQSSHRAQSGTSHATHFLEDRVANLERQNQILQAALLAALNAGVKSNLDGLQESAISPAFSPAGLANPHQGRFSSRPESWVSSSRSSEHNSLETSSSYRDNRVTACQLDNMMEDIDGGWLSDKSSLSGARHVARNH
ncbi:uncharacterized protein N7459_001785 [Penicillium hispanicum]|uniref:uncharacterized protein n=1 Tax=Penicillium hispanicum TaxID=1080232 RepID=UPI002541DCA3|nr:uncharacterized protein N7459_001785 [Penicillium hispanicum]KAJ5595577.1 hypothetical protein N7459_001785 [Penicillium hispanicum]